MYPRTLFLLFILLFTISGRLAAQNTIIVNDDDLTTGTYVWSPDNEYILNGIVVLEAGGELTIQAGTVVRGRGSLVLSQVNICTSAAGGF